jgi:hypothetical protein
VSWESGAIESVELNVCFLVEEDFPEGYFMAKVGARVPGFD